MITKGEAILGALRWLDEATVGGCAAENGEVADLKERMGGLLNGVLQDLGSQFRLYGEKRVVQSPMPVVYGRMESRLILPGEVFQMSAPEAGSFYLEVSGAAEIVLNGIETICCGADCGGFSVYRGNLPESRHEATVTARSTVPFFVRNAALYRPVFAREQDVPVYAPFVPYTMPEDFRGLEKIVRVDGAVQEEWRTYRRQGERTFLLPYGVPGEFCFSYVRRPAKLAENAGEETVLDCHPAAEELVALKLAVDVTGGMEEKAELSAFLEGRFEEMQRRMKPEEICPIGAVETVYGVNECW